MPDRSAATVRRRDGAKARRHTVAAAIGAATLCWVGLVASAAGQAPPDPGVQMSENVFKNVQVLKGIPVDEFMDVMGMFSSSLGYDCSSCHSDEIHTDRAAFAVTTPAITRARGMVAMTANLNRMYFGGQPRITCFTCHRGNYRPENIPSLALQYAPLFDDPNAIAILPDRRTTVDQVFDRYMKALGGADHAARLTSYVARGSYAGFNTGGADLPIEIYAKAPNQRTQIVRAPDGDSVKTFDGRTAWAAEGWRPLPLMALTGGNLTGLRADAIVAFPAEIRKAFAKWDVGTATVDDKNMQVLQGTNPGELPVNLYFDDAGLLVRQVRWNKTAAGTVPTQVDYSDYREVAGVKVPFHLVMTWTDGQNTLVLSEVRPNVAIEAARFAKPAPFQRK
jgi:hypothetical protein